MLALAPLSTFVMAALNTWMNPFQVLKGMEVPPKTTTTRLTVSLDKTMPWIRCKECGKVWPDVTEYKNDQGCDKAHCQNTEEAIRMSRRRGRHGRDTLLPEPVIDNATIQAMVEVPKPVITGLKLQVHMTYSRCFSQWDDSCPSQNIVVPDAININIFPRGR